MFFKGGIFSSFGFSLLKNRKTKNGLVAWDHFWPQIRTPREILCRKQFSWPPGTPWRRVFGPKQVLLNWFHHPYHPRWNSRGCSIALKPKICKDSGSLPEDARCFEHAGLFGGLAPFWPQVRTPHGKNVGPKKRIWFDFSRTRSNRRRKTTNLAFAEGPKSWKIAPWGPNLEKWNALLKFMMFAIWKNDLGVRI